MNDIYEIKRQIKSHHKALGGGETAFTEGVPLVPFGREITAFDGDNVTMADGEKMSLCMLPDISLLQLLEALVSLRIDRYCEERWLSGDMGNAKSELEEAFGYETSVNFMVENAKPLMFSNGKGIYWITRSGECLTTDDKRQSIWEIIDSRKDYDTLISAVREAAEKQSEERNPFKVFK